MNHSKRILSTLGIAMLAIVAMAQSGTNSPYSQYGLGILSDQSQGFNRGMNGLAYGLHQSNQVNFLNPASYANVDSLTFLFDIGISLQNTNFKENGASRNAKNSNFEYAVGAFRLAKGMGFSFGVIPFTNIGYSFSDSSYVSKNSSTYNVCKYSGTGGLHQAYIGMGVSPFKNFSLGANISYLWGDYTKAFSSSYNDSYVNSLYKIYSADVKSYKLDLGLQYLLQLDKKTSLTLGAVYGFGHKLGADPECEVISTNSSTGVSDTTKFSINNGLSIPSSFGAGFAIKRAEKWTVGMDYSLQKWGNEKLPDFTITNDVPKYALSDNMLMDRHKFTIGGEIIPDAYNRSLFGRIHYRAGMSYATPYIKINGVDGPKEMSASLGFGIPIQNGYNNRSILNISGQWVHSSAKEFITENTFRINIGITFNERWFMKWKVE